MQFFFVFIYSVFLVNCSNYLNLKTKKKKKYKYIEINPKRSTQKEPEIVLYGKIKEKKKFQLFVKLYSYL